MTHVVLLMLTYDIKQLLDYNEVGAVKLPDPVGAHNALVDARWNRMQYLHTQNPKKYQYLLQNENT